MSKIEEKKPAAQSKNRSAQIRGGQPSGKSASKRDELRLKRQQKERNQRIGVIAAVVVVALVIVGLLVLPSLKPVGEVVVPTPIARTQVDGLTMGDPNAPVKVIEYADFQCPACKSYVENLEPMVIERYIDTGKVYFTYHPFSFIDDQGPGRESKASAEAAYCASDQGKFWEYHDIVFANQTGENIGAYSDKRLKAFAEQIGLDTKAFNACFDGRKYSQKVLDDKAAAMDAKVNQTPTFVINGKAYPANELLTGLELAYADATKTN